MTDQIEISEPVIGYLMDIVDRTRHDVRFTIGASPRGTIALTKAARVFAAFQGRTYVTPDDVKMLAPYVLAHRLHYRTAVGSEETEELFRETLNVVPVPTEN
jgi:MoxR-like ATPase